MYRLYGKFASYLRRLLCKTRLIFLRINGPIGNEVGTGKPFLTNERMELENVSQTVSNWGSLPRHVLKFIFLSFCSFFTTRLSATLIWKQCFIVMQIKLLLTWKALHMVLFRKWRFFNSETTICTDVSKRLYAQRICLIHWIRKWENNSNNVKKNYN